MPFNSIYNQPVNSRDRLSSEIQFYYKSSCEECKSGVHFQFDMISPRSFELFSVADEKTMSLIAEVNYI